jgi:energy-coupling factor transporter ATP-binding protein EcfA2
MSESISLPLGHDIDNENRIISYLMRNLSSVSVLKEDYFLHPQAKALYRALFEIKEKNLAFSLDTTATLVKEYDPNISYELIRGIHENYTDYSNIEHGIKILKNDWIKFKTVKTILENTLTKVKSRGYVDPGEIRILGESMIAMVDDLQDPEAHGLTAYEMGELYKKEIENRDKGYKVRTYGFPCLDELVLRPAYEGEMTTIFGESGSGKSTVVKNMENRLLNKKVCVLSINPEMGYDTSMEKYLGIRYGMPINKEIYESNMNPRVKARLFSLIEHFQKIPNLYYVKDPRMNLGKARLYLDKARQQFIKEGVLPADGYVFIVADLFSMFEEFDDASPKQSETIMNKWSTFLIEEKCHAINVVQSNENKYRTGKVFKNAEELDFYRLGLEDVKNGSSFKERSRAMISINNPLYLKRRFFPERKAEWDLLPEVVQLHLIKSNTSQINYTELVFTENYKMDHYKREYTEQPAQES